MTSSQFNVRSWVRSLGAGALGGIVLGLLSGIAVILAIGETPPITIRAAREVDGVAVRGGRLDLLFTVDRTRDCPATTSRYLWRWVEVDGTSVRQFVPLGTSPSVSTLVGESNSIIISISIPPDLTEGEWFYWSSSINYCYGILSSIRPILHQTPNIPVRIAALPQAMKEPRL